jgi:dipeptidyl aminopeptidase/acylaminoacyl peptidase
LNQNQAFDGPAGEEPAWAPEGQRLAYRGCDEEAWHINTIQVIGPNFDLSSIHRLTTGHDSQPAWAWDGQRIAFVRREADNQDIYTIRADGSHLVRLTDHPAADVSPAWTPDHRLVFRSLRDGEWGLYVMNADGSGVRHLIRTPAPTDRQPDRLAVSTDVLVAEPPKPQIQIPAGNGLLAISNRKNNDEMTFTIDNVEHKIGPYQVRLLPLKPGHYTWTASWPGKHSRNGIADIVLGQVAYPVVEQ